MCDVLHRLTAGEALACDLPVCDGKWHYDEFDGVWWADEDPREAK